MEKRMKSVWVWIFMSVLAAGLLCAGETEAQETIWRMHSNMQGGPSFNGMGYGYFAERVAKNSGGRLKVEVYFSSALGYKGSEMLSCVRDGLVDVAEISVPMSEGEEPALGLSDLPQLYNNFDDFYAVKNKVIRPFYGRAIEGKWNQLLLWHFNWPWMNIFSRKPIAKPEDFKGLKIRAIGKRDVMGMTALGAIPVALPTGEIYTSVQRGLCDAVLTSCASATELHLWQVCPYMNIVHWYLITGLVTVNKDRFNKLPKDLQEAVLLAGREADDYMVKLVADIEKEKYDLLEKNGMKYVYPNDPLKARMVEVARDLWEGWAKGAGPEGKEALAKVKAAVGK